MMLGNGTFLSSLAQYFSGSFSRSSTFSDQALGKFYLPVRPSGKPLLMLLLIVGGSRLCKVFKIVIYQKFISY